MTRLFHALLMRILLTHMINATNDVQIDTNIQKNGITNVAPMVSTLGNETVSMVSQTIKASSSELLILQQKELPPSDAKENDVLEFWHAIFASISVILVSELGDKTWFIAAILAMKHSRLTVFVGAISALSIMTFFSAFLGWATQIIPRIFTYYVSTALFALFGLKMLKEGWEMSPSEQQEEYEDAQAKVQKKEMEIAMNMDEVDIEMGGRDTAGDSQRRCSVIFRFISHIFLEAFTLTFLAEWGDRSQLTTIILAARESVVGVCVGGILGHAICTGIAVVGGRLVAQQISVRTVTLIGGIVFIFFAFSALILNPDAS